MNDFWNVYEYCGKQYDTERQAALDALQHGDATAFTIARARQDAFRAVQDYMSDLLQKDAVILGQEESE